MVRFAEVFVPEWVCTVRVRGLTPEERDRFALEVLSDPDLAQVRLVALAAVDAEGKPLFDPDDLDVLAEKSASALERLAGVIRRLSGMVAAAPGRHSVIRALFQPLDDFSASLRALFRPEADLLVSTWVRWFRETGNPLFAWEAYQAARSASAPIPEEVLVYLDGVATSLCEVAQNSPEPKTRAKAVARALGLQKEGPGQGGPFSEFQKRTRNLAVALDVKEAIDDWAVGQAYQAHEDTAKKHGLGRSQVRTIAKQVSKEWDRQKQ